MTDKPTGVEPAWIAQARELHSMLVERAVINEHHELVWEGKIRELFFLTGASNASYTRIMRLLVASELVTFVQRGNRHQPTIILVRKKLWPDNLLPAEHLTEGRHAATLVAGIEKQVESLTAWRESLERGGLDVAEVLKDFEVRITRLERELLRNAKKSKA